MRNDSHDWEHALILENGQPIRTNDYIYRGSPAPWLASFRKIRTGNWELARFFWTDPGRGKSQSCRIGKTRAAMLNQRPLSAVSRPVLVMQPNDSTEATLPDAEIDHLSRPGPKLPVVLLPVNVGYGETKLLAVLEPVSNIQFSTRLFSGTITGAQFRVFRAFRFR